jgi:hypothetical protein
VDGPIENESNESTEMDLISSEKEIRVTDEETGLFLYENE